MRYRNGLSALLCLIVPLAGCAKERAAPLNGQAEEADIRNSAVQRDLPASIEGSGWYLPWKARNPKDPNGPPVSVLTAYAASGKLSGLSGVPTFSLQGVHATLYSAGKPSARLNAARVTADEQNKVVNAAGGVRIYSISNPPDTIVTGDSMKWKVGSHLIEISGNVHTVNYRNGKPEAEGGGDRLIYDMATKKISLENNP